MPILEPMLAGATAGVVAALIVLVHRFGASTDNLLNFFGGAVGAGLAVLGSRWLSKASEEEKLHQLGLAMGLMGYTAAKITTVGLGVNWQAGLMTYRHAFANAESRYRALNDIGGLLGISLIQVFEYARDVDTVGGRYLEILAGGLEDAAHQREASCDNLIEVNRRVLQTLESEHWPARTRREVPKLRREAEALQPVSPDE